MSLINIAYLVLVVAGFASFFAALFSVWVWTNWSEWFPPRGESLRSETGAAHARQSFRKAA